MARLISIVYQPQNARYTAGHDDDFLRTPVETAELVADHGIRGDRKAGRNPRRQLNILSAAWLAAREREGYATAPGRFGEQLIVEGLDVDTLRPGDRLRLGEAAQVEITMPREGCTRLEAAQGKQGLDGKDIGVLARVVAGGTIRVGDDVTVLTPDAA